MHIVLIVITRNFIKRRRFMKTGRLKVAARITVLAAIIVCGFLINVSLAAAPDVAATALLFSYYDVKGTDTCGVGEGHDFETNPNCGGLGLTDNYFAVTSNSTNWVQAHLRVRTGELSIELLDFDFLLSPKDVFTFDLLPSFKSGNGVAFVSCDQHTLEDSGFATTTIGDKHCVILDTADNTVLTSHIQRCEPDDDLDTALTETMEGYVEVIGEGIIIQAHDEKDHCASFESDETHLDGLIIPGRTMRDMLLGVGLNEQPCGEECQCDASDIGNMIPVLKGEVYYADLVDGVVVRLASMNADGIDNMLPAWNYNLNFSNSIPGTDYKRVILHADSADLEAARCASEGDLACFTYGEPQISLPILDLDHAGNAAQDINDCFYTPKLPDGGGSPTGVYNKFGAGATFGPTLADLEYRRNGRDTKVASILNGLSFDYSAIQWTRDMFMNFSFIGAFKEFAESHIFNVPAPNPLVDFDLKTKFAFTFPFKHFIDETTTFKLTNYDTDENTKTVTTSKFISPGPIQGQATLLESALTDVNWDFPEGYAVWSFSSTNKTKSNEFAGGEHAGGLTRNVLVRDGSFSYIPGYTGVAFTTGANQIDARGLWYFSTNMNNSALVD
jgi:hypothetical protein